MVIHPVCHPAQKEGVPPGLGGLEKILPPGPFKVIHHRGTNARDHSPASQSGRAVDSYPNSVHMVELDILMCHHRRTGLSSPQSERVQNRVPCHDPVGRPRRDLAPPRAGFTNGAGGCPGSSPCIRCPSTETGNQDGGVAHRVAVHGERNVDWG